MCRSCKSSLKVTFRQIQNSLKSVFRKDLHDLHALMLQLQQIIGADLASLFRNHLPVKLVNESQRLSNTIAMNERFLFRVSDALCKLADDESFQIKGAVLQQFIQSKEHTDHWQFVEVYTDKGITGTSTAKREGFNRMIQDALAGKIDLIITKSVSRFARNTVDTLTTIRKLKEHGVEVYFEEQNI